MDVFEILGIKQGDTIKVDNPWSQSGPKDVVPLGLSRNGISIRAIDTRYGTICYVSADWEIYIDEENTTPLTTFPQIKQNLEIWKTGKTKQENIPERFKPIAAEDMKYEVASIEEVLNTINLENKKIVITGTLPVPRQSMISLLESKGASVTGSISKQTTFLLMGNTGRYEITSKMKKAHSLGVKVITL